MPRTQPTMLDRSDNPSAAPDAPAMPADRLRRRRQKLVFVIAHLGAGGAQRVAVNAANALVERGYDVEVVVLYRRREAYRIDPRVVVHSDSRQAAELDADAEPGEGEGSAPARPKQVGGVRGYIKRYPPLYNFALKALGPAFAAYHLSRITVLLRRKLKKIEPDAVLSFLTQTNIATVLATRGLDIHTVISERNDPRLQRQLPRIALLRRLSYPWADVVTANSRGALDAFRRFVPEKRLAFLPNPLVASSSEDTFVFTAPTVITVGRLVEQKGVDVLLDAWAKVAAALPDWRLALVGDGPLAGALKERAERLGIGHSIDWIGHVSDPFPYLRGAALFVMTSRFEGTPNALLEAMTCGLPAVVSDASPGPCELIGGGDDAAGLIVPVEDASATADAVIRLAGDSALRERMGRAARERARVHDVDQAIDVWVKLLNCE